MLRKTASAFALVMLGTCAQAQTKDDPVVWMQQNPQAWQSQINKYPSAGYCKPGEACMNEFVVPGPVQPVPLKGPYTVNDLQHTEIGPNILIPGQVNAPAIAINNTTALEIWLVETSNGSGWTY